VDDLVMEFKTITGNIRKVKENYKDARKKADNVFLKIDAAFTPEQVLKTLIGTLRRGNYTSGLIIAYFTTLKKIYYWNTDTII
jgi:ATP sulfurylase